MNSINSAPLSSSLCIWTFKASGKVLDISANILKSILYNARIWNLFTATESKWVTTQQLQVGSSQSLCACERWKHFWSFIFVVFIRISQDMPEQQFKSSQKDVCCLIFVVTSTEIFNLLGDCIFRFSHLLLLFLIHDCDFLQTFSF